MRVIAKRTLREFWKKHADAKQPLQAWYQEVEKASWDNFQAIKRDYPSASILKNNRICFNIKGNRYRLIVRINLEIKIVWVRFIGTHSDYNKIDANTI